MCLGQHPDLNKLSDRILWEGMHAHMQSKLARTLSSTILFFVNAHWRRGWSKSGARMSDMSCLGAWRYWIYGCMAGTRTAVDQRQCAIWHCVKPMDTALCKSLWICASLVGICNIRRANRIPESSTIRIRPFASLCSKHLGQARVESSPREERWPGQTI